MWKSNQNYNLIAPHMFRYSLREYTQNILKVPVTITCHLQTKLNAFGPYLSVKFTFGYDKAHILVLTGNI